MAFTTPGTATAGEVLTAAFWNANVRDNSNDLRSYQNRYARAKRTTGTLTLNSNVAWANVDTGIDLTLNASANDVIEYAISAFVVAAAVELYFDVVTVVAGNPVTSFALDATPANPPTSYGVQGWLSPQSVQANLSGSAFRTLSAGDISTGTVTLRLRYASSAATNRNVNASAPQPLEVWARNHGPVTT
jgi:hypothetical protein